MVLLVCAVARELRAFASRAHVEMLVTGVGPVEAGLATARALALAPFKLVINAGIGGAFAGRASHGDIVAVARESYAELGREDGEDVRLPGGASLVQTAASDERFIAAYRDGRLRGVVGDGVTSATLTTSDARAESLRARFDAAVESMEGFAVLRAAEAAGVPALELRGISNIVGDRERGGWDIGAGSNAVARALDEFFNYVNPGTL